MCKFERLIIENTDSEQFIKAIDTLCSSYSGDTSERRVWTNLSLVLPQSYWYKDVSSLADNDGYTLANNLIMKYGRGEKVIKYHLAKKFISNENEVSLFEMKILDSRLDYARINGTSHVYEIKTENDSTERLLNQIRDYELLFEYITVVVHKKHLTKVRKLLNKKIGIISYQIVNGEYLEEYNREPEMNKLVQKKATIKQLTGLQLKELLKNQGYKCNGKTVDQLRRIAMKVVPKDEVLNYFKESTKKRFRPNWNFTRNNFGRIRPIDLQSAFSKCESWVEIRGGSSFRLNDGVE
tara:strand:- start:1203 stop:2087 length:885 start_codon:yes stop_codon:yes gene_type:complete